MGCAPLGTFLASGFWTKAHRQRHFTSSTGLTLYISTTATCLKMPMWEDIRDDLFQTYIPSCLASN